MAFSEHPIRSYIKFYRVTTFRAQDTYESPQESTRPDWE